MSLLSIRTFPDPILRNQAADVTTVDNDIRRLADDMLQTMYWSGGIGLAAPQVGVSLRIIVVDVASIQGTPQPLALINPNIVQAEGEAVLEEGCLSVPDCRVNVSRAAKIHVEFIDLQGRPAGLAADGMLARAIQHEIDHCDGMLILDRLKGLKKELVRRRLKKQAEKNSYENG